VRLFHTGDEDAAPEFAHLAVEKRRMTKDDLAGVEGLKERTAYVCGPEGFTNAAVTWLQELGIPADRVRQEKFNF